MKRIIADQPLRVGEWVSERIGGRYHDQSSTAIGLERDGILIAGVIFDNYFGQSITMHIASEGKHWLTREFQWFVFWYAFKQLKVKKVIGPVDSANEAVNRYAVHLGSKLEAVIKNGARHGDLNIYTMTAEQCRFIGEEYEKRSAACA